MLRSQLAIKLPVILMQTNSTVVLSTHSLAKRPEEMFELVEKFIRETEVEDLYHENFRKGAFLAQDPDALREPRDGPDGPDGPRLQLDRNEHEALRREKESKWNQKWTMYALVGCCSLGAAVQGW